MKTPPPPSLIFVSQWNKSDTVQKNRHQNTGIMIEDTVIFFVANGDINVEVTAIAIDKRPVIAQTYIWEIIGPIFDIIAMKRCDET